MKYYVGIDLGTTNSSISSFDGKDVRTWKSPDQTDVTPSAIYIGRKGNRYYGMEAYNKAARTPDDVARFFKRFMGTNQKMHFKSVNIDMTPVECSAEIIKRLFEYLPEDIREDTDEIGTIITVPAAFDQVKKNATLDAARMASLKHVTVMQEPVAAIMSVMRSGMQNGNFLVYDLGGGTFDISIANNINGKVTILSHGGIEMCGGRDIDRNIFKYLVKPWLLSQYAIPEDFLSQDKYREFYNIVLWAIEKAKINLSVHNSSKIYLSEDEINYQDENGEDIYLDVPVSRENLDKIIHPLVDDTIVTVKETMQKAGMASGDFERIVFIGGPTNYKPLRDSVSAALGIPADIDVNPMTAVSEGASIFCESIDWTTVDHQRKSDKIVVQESPVISFRFNGRTSQSSTKFAAVSTNDSRLFLEVISKDTGWTSGRTPFTNRRAIVDLTLAKNGENVFTVKVYAEGGETVHLAKTEITIIKTFATISAIPASHSIGVEVLDKLNGEPTLDFLVKEGDSLPKKGRKIFRAGQSLRAGSLDSLNFKLWEGDIMHPITDNRFVGVLRISGTDFESESISVGDDIFCDYEMADSGALSIQISIPAVTASFDNRNFYSHQEAEVNLSDIPAIITDGKDVVNRIDEMATKVSDQLLENAKQKALVATSLETAGHVDPEMAEQAINAVLEAKRLVAKVYQAHLEEMRRMDLDFLKDFYAKNVQNFVSSSEKDRFQNMFLAAERAIDNDDSSFSNILDEIRGLNFHCLFQQDSFVVAYFNIMKANPRDFSDMEKFNQLVSQGNACIRRDNLDGLRDVMRQLFRIEIVKSRTSDLSAIANILKG